MLGVKLGDEITHFDSEIKRLKTENTALETQVYQANSLSKAASMAAELSFNNKNQPIYMDNPAYAMR
jgi:cell division protein FtsL